MFPESLLNGIRIIFSDIDGTLLPFDGKDLTPTAELIERLLQAGYEFVPCTGRGTGNIPQKIREVPGLRYAVTANGAMVTDLIRGERIYEKRIPRDLARELTDFLRSYDGYVFSYREGQHFIDVPSGRTLPHTDSLGLKDWLRSACPLDFDDYLAQPESALVDKVGFATFNPEARQAVMEAFPSQPFAPLLSPTTSGIWNVEFGAAGVNKGSAALWLADRLGIPATAILAAGDNINDVPMLEIAALSLAPENADPLAKKAAHVLVEDCREDGVEKFWKKWLL